MIGYLVFGWFYLGGIFLALLVIDESLSIWVHSVHTSLIENVCANSCAKANPYCFSCLACVCGLEFRSWIVICMSDMRIFVSQKWKLENDVLLPFHLWECREFKNLLFMQQSVDWGIANTNFSWCEFLLSHSHRRGSARILPTWKATWIDGSFS